MAGAQIRKGGSLGARESFPDGSVGSSRAPAVAAHPGGGGRRRQPGVGDRAAWLTRSQGRVRRLRPLSPKIIHASPPPL